MKKFLAIFVCMVLMVTMIPSFFASAAPVVAEEGVVSAANDEQTGGLSDVIALVTGLFKAIFGEEVMKEFLPALKEVLKFVSIGEFFTIVGKVWEYATKR